MNKKTLLFLDALAENYCAEEMNAIAREQLQKLFCDTFRESWPTEYTAWITTDAKTLKAQLEQCWDRILNMVRPSDGVSILKSITALHGRWQELCEVTAGQLYLPGAVDLARIHVVRSVEDRQFAQWFLELIQIQLYRVLVLGGAERFRAMPRLEDETAEGLVSYYREHIMPALETLTRVELSGVWTIAWTPEMTLGDRFAVPGCRLAEPEDSGCSYLPGHYRRMVRGKQRVYEGRGALTNITPETILQAQYHGFLSGDQIRVSDMLWMQESDMNLDPISILNRSTKNDLYAAEPYDFFSKWGFACGMVRLRSRSMEGSCPICGGILGRRDAICGTCRNVMVQI